MATYLMSGQAGQWMDVGIGVGVRVRARVGWMDGWMDGYGGWPRLKRLHHNPHSAPPRSEKGR